MVNPVDIGLRIAQALDGIGIKMGSYIGKSSNVKKAMFGGKSTMFKPNAIQALRGEGKNFDDALKLIEEEAQFIVNATDAEKMAFLNNLNDYKDLGGPLKKDIVASKQFEEGIGSLKDDIEDLQSSTSDLLTTAKSMKDDAEKGLKSAEDDLKTFLETGGNPLKKKEEKYLGGSMHEEGQLRTAIRTFLKNEFKNGRIKLDETDKFRVMEYSPMMEDDPIKVFKKIYGDEAYNKAGSFPGAFEIGEDFNHYESIFRSKMGEDILKVKDKKYVGDGTLMLTDEVRTPTPDEDVPFAKGGRAGFAGGGGLKRIVQEIIEYITTKFTPMDAMKEINKVVGKTGKYKNLKLTDDDINDIVEGSNDFIFQRDPDNLFVEGSIKERTKYFDDADEAGTFFPKTSKDKSIDEMSIEETLETAEGLGATKMAERFKLKQKYPGIDDDLLTKIIEDTDPVHKASVLAKIDMAMELGKTNKSADEIIDILKKEPETKMATGGRAGYYGGGQAMIEPDLSDIGHGSDSLMARTRITAPGSQATTSTGLNYLLGEDNDNIRVPFGGGGTMGASDKGYQGGGRDKKGSVSGTAPGAAPVGGGSEDRGKPQQNENHRDAMRNYQKPPESKLKNLANTAQEANYFYNLYKGSPQGVALSIFGKKFGEPAFKKFGLPLIDKLKNLRSEAEIEEEDGIMQMANNDFTKFNFEDLTGMKPVNNLDYVKTAGLNQPQVDYLNKVGNKVIKVSPEGGSLFTYDSPKAIKKEIESLNPKSTNILGTFKPDKIVEGDKNTYATDQDVENYMKSNFPNLTTDGTIIGLADGGIAGLRQGYVGGGGVNLARRGFLKVLAGTGAAVAAFKTGALKLLGKSTTKAAPKLFTAAEGSGAPAWFEGMVNKVLADGVDITKKAATMDGQTVKSLDTPTGKVDVTIDRTGNIDVNYMGDNTALGEGVDMRYVVGQADETTKVKPGDDFEAIENIPEGQMTGPDDYNVEFAENATSDVSGLYSDTSELAELGGQKPLIKDISNSIKKNE